MKCTIATISSLLLLFTACSADPSAAVPGTYKIDTKALQATMEVEMKKGLEGKTEAEKKMAQGMMEQMIGPMVKAMGESSMTFKADKTFEGKGPGPTGEMTVKGTWKLEGDKLTCTTTEENGNEKDEVKVATFKGGAFTLTEKGPDGKEMAIKFAREAATNK